LGYIRVLLQYILRSKRPTQETYTRDQQKSPAKETCKRDLQKRSAENLDLLGHVAESLKCIASNFVLDARTSTDSSVCVYVCGCARV